MFLKQSYTLMKNVCTACAEYLLYYFGFENFFSFIGFHGNMQ